MTPPLRNIGREAQVRAPSKKVTRKSKTQPQQSHLEQALQRQGGNISNNKSAFKTTFPQPGHNGRHAAAELRQNRNDSSSSVNDFDDYAEEVLVDSNDDGGGGKKRPPIMESYEQQIPRKKATGKLRNSTIDLCNDDNSDTGDETSAVNHARKTKKSASSPISKHTSKQPQEKPSADKKLPNRGHGDHKSRKIIDVDHDTGANAAVAIVAKIEHEGAYVPSESKKPAATSSSRVRQAVASAASTLSRGTAKVGGKLTLTRAKQGVRSGKSLFSGHCVHFSGKHYASRISLQC
jgi:hypothetical protein